LTRADQLHAWEEAFRIEGVTDLRLDLGLWRTIHNWVFDLTRGEQAGVLLARTDAVGDGDLLVGERFLPITEEYVLDRAHGLRYDGRFNLRIAEAAERSGCGAILIHAHGLESPPIPSSFDSAHGVDFLAFMRRRRPDGVHGLLVVGETRVTGVCETRTEYRAVRRLVATGAPTLSLPHEQRADPKGTDPRDRQLLAVGSVGQAALAQATVSLVGVSGGGSHVAQQLIHAGVGMLIPVDPDIVDERNLRRLVGATRDDVDRTGKVMIPARLADTVRPEVEVVPIEEEFPSTETINRLRLADVLVGCVDGWDTRDALNDFALQHRIPYVDIGASITPPAGQGMRVGGQIAIVMPDGPCLRCMGLVTDPRVAASRQLRQGYAEGVDAPQVVSINGTLASEAVTAVLMLIAGDDRFARYRRYAYPPGTLTVVDAERRSGCPACRTARLL
jgi:molybdopterin-synthase adenylyltransferase